MYRLVVVLMILSLSGSEAASSSQYGIGMELEEEESPVQVADFKLRTAIEFWRPGDSDFYKAGIIASLFHLPEEQEDGTSYSMRKILSSYSKLDSIYEDLEDDDARCRREEIDYFRELQSRLSYGRHGGSDVIDMNRNLYLIRSVFEISERFFEHCMGKLKSQFDSAMNDHELKDAIEEMGEFEIFIDKEKEALRGTYPRNCNREIQVINYTKLRELINRSLIRVGMRPLPESLPTGMYNFWSLPEVKSGIETIFARTCKHKKFTKLRPAMEFIMDAKKSLRFNPQSNYFFDCGENMGRFQLCEEVSDLILL